MSEGETKKPKNWRAREEKMRKGEEGRGCGRSERKNKV